MTAKSARKHFFTFLALAIGSSVATGQSPRDELELTLEPSTAVTSQAKLGDTAELEIRRNTSLTRPRVLAQTVAHPTRIERSIVETPSVKAVPVVLPTAPSAACGSCLTPVTHGSDALATATPASRQVVEAAEFVRQRFSNGKPQTERWVAEDTNGNIVNHGKYIEYDATGATLVTGDYVHGLREGVWTKQLIGDEAQQSVGQIDKGFQAPFSSQATFKLGQLDGDWAISDARGKLLVVWAYSEGARNGTSSWFNSQGEVSQAITYKSNLADGPARMADSGGTAKETTFTNGLMLRQVDKWYPLVAGKQRILQAQEWHLVPMPLNVTSSDWARSHIEYRSTAGIEPIRQGISVTFYTNGQRESEGNYDHGRRTGTFAWWYPNGQQKTVGEYRNDAEHNEWTWWHENGMKQASGMYVDGRRVNEWSLWSPEGTLVKRSQAVDRAQVADRVPASEAVKNR